MTRLLVESSEELNEACEILDDNGIDFDLDSGNRIIVEDGDAAMELLDNAGIDYDII